MIPGQGWRGCLKPSLCSSLLLQIEGLLNWSMSPCKLLNQGSSPSKGPEARLGPNTLLPLSL